MKKTISIILMLIILLGVCTISNAADTTEEESESIEWTDFSNAKIEIDNSDGNAFLDLKITNINGNMSKFDYYYEISTKKQTLNLENVKNLCTKDEVNKTLTINRKELNKYYPLSDDIYLTIKMKSKEKLEEKIAINAEKINKLELNSIENRIKASITTNHVSIAVNECIGEDRTVKTKIGSVTDKDLLNSIKENKNGWRQQLLEYAKKANSINDGTVSLVDNIGTYAINTNLNLVEGAYYFLYLEVDNENGKYYTVEDVYFTQAKKISDGEYWITTDWNFEDEPEEAQNTVKVETPVAKTNNVVNDSTVAKTKLPQTGENVAIIISIIGLAILAIIVRIQYVKYKGI